MPRAAYRDDAGQVPDFHALRDTFASNLAAGDVHPKTAQELLRHSTIGLTMDTYTHATRERGRCSASSARSVRSGRISSEGHRHVRSAAGKLGALLGAKGHRPEQFGAARCTPAANPTGTPEGLRKAGNAP
ncbi:MAG: tyrosine-type recombinase/integrase [Planctomycetota bacterium]